MLLGSAKKCIFFSEHCLGMFFVKRSKKLKTISKPKLTKRQLQRSSIRHYTMQLATYSSYMILMGTATSATKYMHNKTTASSAMSSRSMAATNI
jgi:hypothetical protein